MDTLKTAIVVVLLLAVLYGVYVILNRADEESLSQDVAWSSLPLEPPQVDLGSQEAIPATETEAPQGLPSPPEWAPPPVQENETLAAQIADSHHTTAADGLDPSQSVAPATASTDMTSGPMPQTTSVHQHAHDPVSTSPLANASESTGSDQPSALEPPTTEIPSIAETPQVATTGRGGDFQPVSPAEASDSSVAVESASANEPRQSSTFSAFDSALKSAKVKIEEKNWHDALWTLSLFYNSPDLASEQSDQLLEWLDALAAKVIYSREHLIEKAHHVQRGESLVEIAEQYGVPWQLLANINGIENPEFLVPGTKVKIVRGPFYADVSLERNELTLFVNKLYAGRFDISLGSDPQPKPGEYEVKDKQAGRTYYASDGRTVPAGDPANPYGQVWLDLGNNICIHGSPQTGPTSSGLGCISLSPVDASDVFGILSLGSRVTVQR